MLVRGFLQIPTGRIGLSYFSIAASLAVYRSLPIFLVLEKHYEKRV